MKADAKKPTEAELEILDVLWCRGRATVREVHGDLSRTKAIGHTTVLKLMQIMTGKGLLVCDRSVRPQVFRPARSRRQTQAQLVGDLLERAFGGSAGSLVIRALSERESTPEERRRIRELLDQLEAVPR